MTRRFIGLLAASMFSAVMLLTTACTSTGGSSSSASATPSSLSFPQVLPLFLQCLIDHNVPIWDRAEGDTSVASLGKSGGWYVNGRVVANDTLSRVAESLEGFYPISPDFKPEQTIAAWVDNAVSNGTWPKVCAPLPRRS